MGHVDVAARPLVAVLGTDRAVSGATDLDLENLQARAERGLEEVVQDVAPLRLWVVDEQPRA